MGVQVGRNATLYQVAENGDLDEVESAEGSTWALKLRNRATELLGETQPNEIGPLSGFEDDAIVRELVERGYPEQELYRPTNTIAVHECIHPTYFHRQRRVQHPPLFIRSLSFLDTTQLRLQEGMMSIPA
jgi:hypothetical protein